MSLDIDWDLLTSSDPSSSLSTHLITSLNAHLASASGPSFIGPISVSAFDFGSIAPSIEIRDIRDVWRAFDDDEDDEEDDDEGYEDEDDWGRATRDQSFDSYDSNMFAPAANPNTRIRQKGRSGDIEEEDEDDYEVLEEDDDEDDNVSVFSGMSPRYSVAGVGMGFGLGAGVGGGTPSATARRLGGGTFARQQSQTIPLSRSISQSLFSPPLPSSARHQRPPTHHRNIRSPISSNPTSPPTYPTPPTLSSSSSGGVPSIQLHLHITHNSNITLTLLTSLQVNYPSSLFMSLPLKLCVTGLTLDMDLVLAYANTEEQDKAPPAGRRRTRRKGGGKGKVHICLTDEDPSSSISVGERIIPNVQIESEIGDGDVHVLRNVGKVERFIVEALRKTIVDELVFPNFHTVVL